MMRDLDDADVDIRDDPQLVAQRAAAWLVERLQSQEGTSVVCLSGGQTPRLLYAALASSPYRDMMPWARIHWFWADERFVPPTDARSNYGMARRLLLDAVPIPRENIHPIPTTGITPTDAAAAYEAELMRFYGVHHLAPDRPLFDVTLLGVGEDGHTASLFPGSPLLHERSRWVAAVPDGKPEARITLTYPALESSRHVAFIVTGAAKRDIVRAIRDGAGELPAARLQARGRTHWFLDRAATPLPAVSALANGAAEPSVIIVMGVSGSGKTTIAALLAGMLRWGLADGDEFHPDANVRKMRKGIPLTDEDRLPWLRAVAGWIDATRAAGKHGVVACSALKRSYRAMLAGGRPDVRLVYLRGDADLIAQRMAARHEHFMPLALLRSQLETLEEPGPEEHAVIVSIAATPQEIASRIIVALHLQQLAGT